jgi:hypothetical protein
MNHVHRRYPTSPRGRERRWRLALASLAWLVLFALAACATVEPKTLSLTIDGTGVGRVTSSPPGIDCTDDCEHAFADGTTVTLTATPTDGSTFAGWGGACDGTGACTVVTTEARAVVATFTAPEAQALACEASTPDGAPGPTLVCTLADGRVTVEVPWQGSAVAVRSLPIADLGPLPTEGDFEPLSRWPLVNLAIVDAATEAPVVAFDPVVWLTVRYGQEEFDAADPGVNLGELGLGAYDAATQGWTVVGHGVFHEGFWLADPIAGGALELRGEPTASPPQPRFAMRGTPSEGEAIALLAAVPETLPLAWGAMPFDPDHMLKEFDTCVETDVAGVPGVECVSAMVGVTVRVPMQGDVMPRVIALPWNKETTFDTGVVPSQSEESVLRRLMNFLVVNADDPTEVLFEFEPPMEFEIAFTREDADPDVNPFLYVTYWDEYVEEFVYLGGGFTGECYPSSLFADVGPLQTSDDPLPNCPWGFPIEADAIPDDPFLGDYFYLWNDDVATGGVARFTYGIWGDRLVAFAR